MCLNVIISLLDADKVRLHWNAIVFNCLIFFSISIRICWEQKNVYSRETLPPPHMIISNSHLILTLHIYMPNLYISHNWTFLRHNIFFLSLKTCYCRLATGIWIAWFPPWIRGREGLPLNEYNFYERIGQQKPPLTYNFFVAVYNLPWHEWLHKDNIVLDLLQCSISFMVRLNAAAELSFPGMTLVFSNRFWTVDLSWSPKAYSVDELPYVTSN